MNISNYTKNDAEENWEYLITEDFPHIGNHSFPAVCKADKNTNQIRIHAAPLYGLMFGEKIESVCKMFS